MENIKTIILKREEVDNAVKEYLSLRDIAFNVEEIHYIIKNDGETLVEARIRAL